MSKLFIIRGIPGSGKSTFAEHLINKLLRFGYDEQDIVHAEADMYFIDDAGNYNFDDSKLAIAHQTCYDKIENALKANKIAIVSNTFVDANSVDKYVKLGEKYDAEITIYRRTAEYKSIHNVPIEVINKMKHNFADVKDEVILS